MRPLLAQAILAAIFAATAVAQQYVISTVAGRGGERGSFSGDGGPATSAHLNTPRAIAVDGAGNLFIADYNNSRVRKVSANGIITTAAGNGGSLGNIGDGGPAINAQLWTPQGVAADAAGNLFIADDSNHRIRKVSPNGIISTVAGNGSLGYSGDGGPAVGAQLVGPAGIAIDSAGNLLIADLSNNRVRKVSSNGTIKTMAGNGVFGYAGDGGAATQAQLAFPSAVAVDSAGNVFVADSGNDRIRKISATGVITTIAGSGGEGFGGDGGPAVRAQLNTPLGVVVDGAGNVFIADSHNNRIRKVSADGVIATVAGRGPSGTPGSFGGDGGPALNAQLNGPRGVAVDGAGKVYVADSGNGVIRVLRPASESAR